MIIVIIILIIILCACLTTVNEYQRGVKFRFGKFHSIMKPGINFLIPLIDSKVLVDVRSNYIDVPSQEAITKDNVSIKINAVVYYHIFDAAKAVIEVQHYMGALGQIAQTTMRNIVGNVTLDELLSSREKVSVEICNIIDALTDPWGIKVENVELKDISLPEEMQRVIAKVAEAERESKAVITKAAGELEASKNLAHAAEALSSAPGALHLRTLATLNDLSSDQSNTIVFAVPIEGLRALEGLADMTNRNKKD